MKQISLSAMAVDHPYRHIIKTMKYFIFSILIVIIIITVLDSTMFRVTQLHHVTSKSL